MKNSIINSYGHCYYCVCNDKGCSMIYNLFIKKDYRRKGHAKDLVSQAMNKIRECGYKGSIKVVAIPEENSILVKDLINFYIKMGLEIAE